MVARKAGLDRARHPEFQPHATAAGDLGKAPAVMRGRLQPGRARRALELHRRGREGARRGAAAPPITSCRSRSRSRRCAPMWWRPGRSSAAWSSPARRRPRRSSGLTAGEPWDSVAKSLGATPEAPKFVARSDQEVPIEVRKDAFDGPKPAGKPVYSSLTLDRRRCGRGAGERGARGSERRFQGAERGGPARIRASGCGRRGAELCGRRPGRRQGDLESAGARLIYGKSGLRPFFGQQLRFRRQKARLLPAAPGGPAVF